MARRRRKRRPIPARYTGRGPGWPTGSPRREGRPRIAGNCSSQRGRPTLYAPLVIARSPRAPSARRPERGSGPRAAPAALQRRLLMSHSRALLCAGFCGKPALPALLGRSTQPAGPSGYWVGHSGGCFAVELMSDREPGLRARLPVIYPPPAGVWNRARSSWPPHSSACGGAVFPGAKRPPLQSVQRMLIRVANCGVRFPNPFRLSCPISSRTVFSAHRS